MRSRLTRRAIVAAAALCSLSVSRAQVAETPLALTLEGTLTATGPILPWPLDPTKNLVLDARVRATATATSTSADAPAQLVDYFNGTANNSGFIVADPATGPLLLASSGRWTNRDGFLLQGSLAGQRTSVVSQDPPVIGLAGVAEVRGLSGRGRDVLLKGNWTGQLNVRTGALRLTLTGAAAGELGPPEVQCGEHTDEGLAGELVPVMTRPDGSPNVDHFQSDGSDGYPRPFPYSTNPPTSGPHAPSWLPEGIYETPQDDTRMVHNLEHGHVIVTYHPAVPAAVLARLRAVVGLYDQEVLLVPRPSNDVPIAVVSWGRLLKQTEYDEPAVQNFIDRNRAHGPECFH
jgi:hypothetical protein